jgi:Transcription factor e(y)2
VIVCLQPLRWWWVSLRVLSEDKSSFGKTRLPVRMGLTETRSRHPFFRLKSSLYAQLMLQESWRDDVKEETREAIKRSGGGLSEITLDELSESLIKTGTAAVPDSVREDLLGKIRQACASQEMR